MNQQGFSYAAQPHAAPMRQSQQQTLNNQTSRAKYRDENDVPPPPNNIMHDSRVVRGNTYSSKMIVRDGPPSSTMRKQPRSRNQYSSSIPGRRTGTPPPVDGRVNMNMQTEDYLEELTDRPVEQDAETQTQVFMDRPPSPLFVRAKIGVDVSTQIEDGELFDFDTEVDPILEVLVGKTLHVAMLEVMQEEELDAIRLQQEEFETIRNVELAELQRLEAELKRRELEKERRLEQEKRRLQEKRDLEEKIAARQFTQQYLGELHVSVFDHLQTEGFFYDPVQREIEDVFMLDLLQNVTRGASNYEAASQMAMELLENARRLAQQYELECITLRREERERIAREEAERLAREAEEAAAAAAAAEAARLAELEAEEAEEAEVEDE